MAKGGGKEGQGPRSKLRNEKDKPKGGAANVAGDKDSVWMAIANDSGDEYTADNEFDNIILTDDDVFFFDEENEREVSELTSSLKQLLKISDQSDSTITYPYDNPEYFLNDQNFTDSSDNEQGAVAMKVSADSDNEVDIEPYWTTIKVNKLHGFGNPMEMTTLNDVDEGSTNSMPDLVSVSDSKESTIFVLGDKKMVDLVEDGGKDSLHLTVQCL